MKFVALVVAILFAVYGWFYFSDDVKRSVNARANFGTLQGVDGCVRTFETSLVLPNTKRDFCSNSLQTAAYVVDVKGFAGPNFDGKKKLFSGTVRNESMDWVITQINFEIEVGESGKSEIVNVLEHVWLEPNSESEVSMEMVSLTDIAWETWRKCSLAPVKTECFSWGIKEQYGVRLGK